MSPQDMQKTAWKGKPVERSMLISLQEEKECPDMSSPQSGHYRARGHAETRLPMLARRQVLQTLQQSHC